MKISSSQKFLWYQMKKISGRKEDRKMCKMFLLRQRIKLRAIWMLKICVWDSLTSWCKMKLTLSDNNSNSRLHLCNHFMEKRQGNSLTSRDGVINVQDYLVFLLQMLKPLKWDPLILHLLKHCWQCLWRTSTINKAN